MEPNVKYSLLENNTQIIVSPKARSSSFTGACKTPVAAVVGENEPQLSTDSNSTTTNRQSLPGGLSSKTDVPQCERYSGISEPRNKMVFGFGSLLSYVKSFWWDTEPEQTDDVLDVFPPEECYHSEISSDRFELCCRVLSLEEFQSSRLNGDSVHRDGADRDVDKDDSPNLCADISPPKIEMLQQSTNVFVSLDTILASIQSIDALPRTFLARLTHIASPAETNGLLKKTLPGIQSKSNRASKTDDPHSADDRLDRTADSKDNEVVNARSCVVRVVVGDVSLNRPVPLHHVLLPDLLRRQMELDITGKVFLESLEHDEDVEVKELTIYPLFVAVSPETYSSSNYLKLYHVTFICIYYLYAFGNFL